MSKHDSTPVIRLCIELRAGALEPTHIQLLERIETDGSLSQAARELRVSYRHY